MKKGKSEGSQAFNVPATDEGKEFVKLLRKFSNRPDCQISIRGRGKRKDKGYGRDSIPLGASEWFAVYVRSAKSDYSNYQRFNQDWAKIQEQMKRIKELEEQVKVKVNGNDRIDSLQATNTAMIENIKKLQNKNIRLEDEIRVFEEQINVFEEQVKGLKIALIEQQERHNELARKNYESSQSIPNNSSANVLLGTVTISVKGANIRIVQEQE